MAVTQPAHLRMPQRAEAVAGAQPQPGQPIPPTVKTDPRTVSQAPRLPINPIIGSKI
jgi:hypothetical protein